MRTEYLFLLPLLAALAVTMTTSPISVNASTGMGNGNGNEGKNGDTQPDRVGADDEGVNRDGPDDEGEANCWGEVTRDFAHTGTLGQHSRNPSPDADNDTPREGVGNQDEDHPSNHADTVGDRISDADCVERD